MKPGVPTHPEFTAVKPHVTYPGEIAQWWDRPHPQAAQNLSSLGRATGPSVRARYALAAVPDESERVFARRPWQGHSPGDRAAAALVSGPVHTARLPATLHSRQPASLPRFPT